MKKVMIINGQVFQSGAWHRGMGKYSFELLKSSYNMLSKTHDKVAIIFNNNLPLEKQAKDAIESIFGSENLISLNLVQSGNDMTKELTQNRTVIDEYIRSNLESYTVDYLILSLFLDNGRAVFPTHSNKFLLFYDSIPFLFPEKYRHRIDYDSYLSLYGTVFEADIIFAISQTVADDTVLNFGINEEKVINIDGARIGEPSKNIQMPKLLSSEDKFILCPTGDELRKNNLRAVQGFELFNQKNNNAYKLILTSFFGDYTKQQLSAISDNIIFTNNIPYDELEWLYENAEILLFPSEYEGLGLPILEAVTHNKKIVCSDIPVFREISNDAFYYFDLFSPVDLSHKIYDALNDKSDSKVSKYNKISEKYTWNRTASIVSKNIAEFDKVNEDEKKPKLAILAPSPDGYSAIGKVVAETHASLSVYFDVTYYFEEGPQHIYLRPDFLSKVANSYPVSKFNLEEYCKYDSVLYHIGNSEYHLATIANSLVYPGYAILHDTNLGGAYGMLRNMGYINDYRYEIERIIDDLVNSKNGKFLSSVVSRQIDIITHSDYAKNAVRKYGKEINVQKINLPVATPGNKRLYLANNKIKIGLAGIIAGIKGLELVEELARSGDDNIEIHIFGYLQSKELKEKLNSIPNVNLVINPTDFEFQTMLSKLDILLNYRMLYQGETSLTVLEAMRYGTAVIVRDIGWYSELPDDVVFKVKTKDKAIEAVNYLINNPKELLAVGKNAKSYIKNNHSHLAYAKSIYDITNSKVEGSKIFQQSKYIKQNQPNRKKLIDFVKKNND
jgi:glycosyltransferase involved in cell wall biosynthesis